MNNDLVKEWAIPEKNKWGGGAGGGPHDFFLITLIAVNSQSRSLFDFILLISFHTFEAVNTVEEVP